MTQKEFEKIIKQATELRAKKNADYGNGFLEAYNNAREINTNLGNIVIYFDLYRKFKRIENILLSGNKIQVSDETIEDTLIDMAVMSINAIIALKNRKGEKLE